MRAEPLPGCCNIQQEPVPGAVQKHIASDRSGLSLKTLNDVKEEEENETKEMSTELGFTCWPHSKPRLGSVWYFKDQCPTGAFIQTLLSMDGQPWLLLEPSLLQHPSLNPAWLQRGERNINSEETDGAIIKSSLSSYFFSHCFRFSGLLPQKQIVLALHMFTLCLFR